MNERTPTLYEVKELTHDYGLVGEERTVLTLIIGFLNGGMILMTGKSSGGKTEAVQAAAYCTPGSSRDEPIQDSHWTYDIPTSMSKTALFERHDEVNSHPVHIHMDIASMRGEEDLEKLWKRHGEGLPMEHSWTEVRGQERFERSHTLNPPQCMVLFLAEDNQQVDINDYPEVRNRALLLPIDDSAELTQKVNERQAKIEAGLMERHVDEARAEEIREYLASVPTHTYVPNGSRGGFLNPAAVALDEQNPMPQHFTEARRDWPRLMDFMKGVALFHHENRMEVPKKQFVPEHAEDQLLTLFVTPADCWYAMRIFGEKMVLSALNLREKDIDMLEFMRARDGQTFTVADLVEKMRERGHNLAESDIRDAMENMRHKAYVRKHDDSSRVEYSASPFAAQAKREVNLDWADIVEETRDVVYEVLPGSLAEEYEDRYLQGDGLIVTHPITGESVNLLEDTANELEEKAAEAQEKESEVFGESMYDGDDEDDDDAEDGGGQGTLT